MPDAFSFRTAQEIRFGRGSAIEAAADIACAGTRIVVVHGRNPDRAAPLMDALRALGCRLAAIACPGEPELDGLVQAVDAARDAQAQLVVALGGGSVLDLGKAVAALVPADGVPLDYLEVVGKGRPLPAAPLPCFAIPTTAGTGAEVTRNAVIGVPAHRRKVSLRDPRMLPDLAVIDPGLTDGSPRGVTLASGLDAVTQVIEPYLCARANPLTDALCRDAIPRGLAALTMLMAREDASARDEIAYVSLCGGLALANAGLGAVHGLSGVIGGVTGAAHGAICGTLLPHVLQANRAAMVKRGRDVARFDEVARMIGRVFDDPGGGRAAEKLKNWSHASGLPRLSDLGIAAGDHTAIAAAAVGASSLKANPVPLSAAELEAVLDAAG